MTVKWDEETSLYVGYDPLWDVYSQGHTIEECEKGMDSVIELLIKCGIDRLEKIK